MTARWGAHTTERWTLQTPDSLSGDHVPMVEVGRIRVPQEFETWVHTFHPEGNQHADVQIWLMYWVEAGEIRLHAVWSTTHEVDEALAWLREGQPLSEWKRLALINLAADEAHRSIKRHDDSGQWVGASAKEVVETTQSAIRQAYYTPLRRRRDRVTDDVLREVAEVYRDAQAAGEPPTIAVKEHFYKSHSSAARWVGRARQGGFLPPVAPSRIEDKGSHDE